MTWLRDLIAKVIRVNDVEQINRRALHLRAGSGVTLTSQDRPGQQETLVTISAEGGGVPPSPRLITEFVKKPPPDYPWGSIPIGVGIQNKTRLAELSFRHEEGQVHQIHYGLLIQENNGAFATFRLQFEVEGLDHPNTVTARPVSQIDLVKAGAPSWEKYGYYGSVPFWTSGIGDIPAGDYKLVMVAHQTTATAPDLVAYSLPSSGVASFLQLTSWPVGSANIPSDDA